MHDLPEVPPLSARAIAWRILPAIIALLMLLIGPPQAWQTGTPGATAQKGAVASPTTAETATSAAPESARSAH